MTTPHSTIGLTVAAANDLRGGCRSGLKALVVRDDAGEVLMIEASYWGADRVLFVLAIPQQLWDEYHQTKDQATDLIVGKDALTISAAEIEQVGKLLKRKYPDLPRRILASEVTLISPWKFKCCSRSGPRRPARSA